MEDQYQNQTPAQTQARAAMPSPDDPSATTRKMLTILLVLVFALGIGALLARTVFNNDRDVITDGTQQANRILDAGEGDLVGIYLRNGTVYFGNVVYEDDKSILLRDVYRPLGYYDSTGGSNPRFHVIKLNANTPQSDTEQLVSKEEVLFSSRMSHPAVIQAIKNYTPPTPTPQPETTPTPESEVQGDRAEDLPETLPTPTPASAKPAAFNP